MKLKLCMQPKNALGCEDCVNDARFGHHIVFKDRQASGQMFKLQADPEDALRVLVDTVPPELRSILL